MIGIHFLLFLHVKNAGTSLTNTTLKSRDVLEKPAVAQKLKKVPEFYKT
jgi:hypothetical protein